MPETYIGTKIVNAMAMTRAQYNEYRGWELPDDEEGSDPGYLVEYTDGGPANHPKHAGYISWSPKALFEGAYQGLGDVSQLAPYQRRVAGERAQLADKLEKLQRAFHNPGFLALPFNERELLKSQSRAMTRYLEILDKRMANF